MDSRSTTASIPSPEEQLGIVCYVAEQKVRQSRMWTSQEKGSRGMEILSRKSDELLSVQMNISQAPLSFRQPVTQKKAFYPPFKIQVSARFGNAGSSIPMKVNAYSLTEEGLVSFLKQISHNSFPALPLDTGLQNACIYHSIENRESSLDYPSCTMTETFEFVDMHFTTSSRMGLRWLLFVARVQGPSTSPQSLLLCWFVLRKTDQYSKACCLLAKSNPVMNVTEKSSGTSSRTTPLSSSTTEKISESSQKAAIPTDKREWILAAYGECRFQRFMTQKDLAYLEASLGLSRQTGQTALGISSLPEMDEEQRCFEAFGKWYLSCLSSLKKEQALWCASDITRICPFAVDRAVSEQILEHQTTGTFLVRISSEPGCFVLSVKEETQHDAYVDHYLIDAMDLTQKSLTDWILQNERAHIFFDVDTGATFPKHVVFLNRMNCHCPELPKSNCSNSPDGGVSSTGMIFSFT